MKKLLFTILAIGSLATTYAQNLDRSIRPKPGPAPEINIADAQTFTLDNGLKVYVVEDHKLPVVTYTIDFDIDVPNDQDKAGIKEFFGSLMSSGTKNRSKKQYIADKDEIAASIGVSSEFAYATSLTKHQDKLLDIFSDCILNPKFSNEELIKIRKKANSGLQANEKDPDFIMSNVSSIVLYGKNHPYSEITTKETINNVNLSDISRYYRTYFRPNVAYMAIVGDVTLEEAKAYVKKYFGSWERADVPKASYPSVPAVNKTTVHFSDRPGAVQSNIMVGNTIDLKRNAADLQAASLMNYVLGGGSSSKLFLNLREDKAWTYGAYSSIRPNKIKGTVALSANCRNEVTDSSITEMLHEMNVMRTENVKADILQGAKNYLNGVFALGLRSPQTIASYAINIDKHNLPKDYYKTYMQKVTAVTAADIKTAANKYLAPEQTNIIVVGNRSEVEKLKKFSKEEMRFYDQYGNPAKAIVNKVINGQTAETIVAKYIDAIGGEAAIKGLTSIDAKGATIVYGTKADFDEKIEGPDKYYKGIYAKMGQSVTTFYSIMVNGNQGTLEIQGNTNKLHESQLAIYKLKANLQSLLQPDSFGVNYELERLEKYNGNDVYLVNKYSGNGVATTRQYYDVSTGLLLKEEDVVMVNNIESITTSEYSNYKEVKNGNGYKMPFTIKEDADGRKNTLEYSSIKANGRIPGVYFKL